LIFRHALKAKSYEDGSWQLAVGRDDCGIAGVELGCLWQESDELMAIFTTMVSKLRKAGN
jgi:hypothetical protein